MYGFTDDVVSGVQRWRDPMSVIQNARTITTEPAGVILGIALPLLAALMVLGGGGGRRR